MLKNLKLSTKIFASIFIIIFGTLIISISSYLSFNKIGNEIKEIALYQIPINSFITELEKDILEEEILTYRFIIACKNVNSKEFKDIEKRVLELEEKTEVLITKTKKMVNKAINHNVDEKTKNAYKSFLSQLSSLEKEQLIYKDMIKKLDFNVKQEAYNSLDKDRKIIAVQLTKMDTKIIALMKSMQKTLIASTLKTEEDEKDALLLIEVISLIVIIISIIIAYALTSNIKNSLKSFQSGLLDFFKYLNKEKEDVKKLDDSSKDEIGTMSKVVNENIAIIKQSLEKDKKVILETVNVLSEFEQGNLSKRVNVQSNNEALNNLTKLLNQMANNIEGNINNILEVLENYTNDNFLVEVQTNNLKEHLLKLANGINNLKVSITKSLDLNKQNGILLQNNSSKLKDDMNLLSDSSLNAATSLEETAAALEEMTKSIKNSTNNIQEMTSYATNVTNLANNGQNLANDTMLAMDEINEKVLSISEAITIIDKIAFQTNILSLNAAVEAASAGEAGKGFAVVAGEVRNLANRSAQAAKEIKTLVENATLKTNTGKSISNKMLEGYKDLNQGIYKTLELIKEVDAISKEQENGIIQINDAITTLDQQTQKNSLIANESSEVANITQDISIKILENANSKKF